MRPRGTYNFEVNDTGNICYSENNVNLLRKLWLDRELVNKSELGPGDPGDFDNGTWHIACHLLAAGGVLRAKNDQLIWFEISYDENTKIYKPTATTFHEGQITTSNLLIDATPYLEDVEVIGFLEGASEGRISAKNVNDNPKDFNGNPRQEYNQEPGNAKEGGKVWEHWCTTRDIRTSNQISSSVLHSYVKLVSILGQNFVSVIARGRTDYDHPKQLMAMVSAGFLSSESVSLNIKPTPIPEEIALLLQESEPKTSFQAINRLSWDTELRYYMFQRSINKWNNSRIS